MTILRANLKHLYQRKGFWLIGLVLIFFAVINIIVFAESILADREKNFFVLFAAWMYIAAIFTSALQVEVLAKPFSWTLPGHRQVPVKFLFCVGVSVSLFWSVVFLFYPAANVGRLLLSCVSVFFAGTIFYWLGAWLVFRFRNWAAAIALFPLLMFGVSILGADSLFERVIVEGWFAVIPAGVLVNYLAWRYWSREGLARRYCGRLWMGAFDAWDKVKMVEFSQARLAEKTLPGFLPGVERFFLDRIGGRSEPDTAGYVWGGLYRSFGLIGLRKKGFVGFWLVMLPVLCFLGYMGPGANMLFFMPGFMVIHMKLGVHSTLLTSGGRRERFWTGVSVAVVTTLITTVIVALMAGVTVALQAVMPELTIKGETFAYHAMEIKLSCIPSLVIPVTLAIALIFYRYPRLMMGAVILVFCLAIQVPLISRYVGGNRLEPGPLHVLVAFACCWAIFVGVLRYVCMRRCLVR